MENQVMYAVLNVKMLDAAGQPVMQPMGPFPTMDQAIACVIQHKLQRFVIQMIVNIKVQGLETQQVRPIVTD